MPKITDAEWDSFPVETTGYPESITAERFWLWLIANMPLTGDTHAEVYGFISRSVPNRLLGAYDLVEIGTKPNRNFLMALKPRELGSAEVGDN